MTRKRILTPRHGFEGSRIDHSVGDGPYPPDGNWDDWDILSDLAQAYTRDKAKLDKKLEEVQTLNVSDTGKKDELIREVESCIADLQEEYHKKVMERQKQLEEMGYEQSAYLQSVADNLKALAIHTRSMHMEAASVDSSGAAAIAEDERSAVASMKREHEEELMRRMKEAAILRQKIMENRNSTQ